MLLNCLSQSWILWSINCWSLLSGCMSWLIIIFWFKGWVVYLCQRLEFLSIWKANRLSWLWNLFLWFFNDRNCLIWNIFLFFDCLNSYKGWFFLIISSCSSCWDISFFTPVFWMKRNLWILIMWTISINFCSICFLNHTSESPLNSMIFVWISFGINFNICKFKI